MCAGISPYFDFGRMPTTAGYYLTSSLGTCCEDCESMWCRPIQEHQWSTWWASTGSFCFSLLTPGAFEETLTLNKCLPGMPRNQAFHPSSFINKICVSVLLAPTLSGAQFPHLENESLEPDLYGSFQGTVSDAMYTFASSVFPQPCFLIISCYLSSKITSMLKCNEKLQNEIFQNIMFYQRTRQ